MPTEPPFPGLAQLMNALARLDADMLAGLTVVGDEEARERLRERVRQTQAIVTAEATAQFADDQDDTLTEMLGLLEDWEVMLDSLHPKATSGNDRLWTSS